VPVPVPVPVSVNRAAVRAVAQAGARGVSPGWEQSPARRGGQEGSWLLQWW
jgi:hypothetical protein